MQSTTTPTSSPSSPSEPRLTVTNKVDVPNKGWIFTVEETGVTLNGGTINQLKNMVHNHMRANNVRIPADLNEIIEDTACRNLDKWSRWCEERKPVDQTIRRSKWTAADVKRFLTTVKNWGTQTRFAFVDQDEAERRAAICAACPMNVEVSGCMGCAGVGAMVKLLRGTRTTREDRKLNYCDVCGCALQVKVHLPLEAVDNSGLEYPPHCWQKPADAEDNGNQGQVDQV